MKCQAVQNQILLLPDPRELPPALREHVVACAGCQAWARQAARLEALLEQLPVAPAPEQKKEAMIGDLMQAEPVIQPIATPAARPAYGLVALRFLRRNAAYVGGLAAAVLIAFGAYVLFNGPKNPHQSEMAKTQSDPFLQKMVARNTALARANTPAEKLGELSGMAEDISSDTRGLARIAPADELARRVRLYEKAVKEGIAKQAADLRNQPLGMTEVEKTKLLDSYAAKLEVDAVASEKLAGEVPPDAQPALRRMAETAREGQKTLRGK